MPKKIVLCLVISLILSWMSRGAHSTTFNFSYTFFDNTVMTGSFTGTANGLYIDDVSNVSVERNGILFNGSPNLFARDYLQSIGDFTDASPARVSFDGTLNNFLFIDSDYPTQFSGFYTNYFLYRNHYSPSTYSQVAIGFSAGQYIESNDQSNNLQELADRWKVTPAIPEPEIYAMLGVGLGLLGWVGRRKKLKEAAVA